MQLEERLIQREDTSSTSTCSGTAVGGEDALVLDGSSKTATLSTNTIQMEGKQSLQVKSQNVLNGNTRKQNNVSHALDPNALYPTDNHSLGAGQSNCTDWK